MYINFIFVKKMFKRNITILNIILVFLLSANSIYAQKDFEFANSTPKETVESHLYFLEKAHYNPKLSSYTLGGDLSITKKTNLARKLKDILLKHKIDINIVLNKRWTIMHRSTYVLFDDLPSIYLERIDKEWRYSAETVSKIDSIHNKYFLKLNDNNKLQNKLDKFIVQHNKVYNTKKKTSTKNDTTSQNNNDSIFSLNLSTPYNTIVNHLMFLDDSLYKPSISARTLNLSPKDSVLAKELAIKLKQIYLGSKKHVLNIDELSTDSNYIDTLTNTHVYYPNTKYQELYLEKIGDKWLYSKSTTELINSAHKKMYSSDAEVIFRFSDKFKRISGSKKSILINQYYAWQMYMLIYFILIGAILYLINSFLIKRILYKILANNKYKKITYKLFKTFSFTIFWLLVEKLLPSFELDLDSMNKLHMITNVAIVFNITLLSIYTVNFLKVKYTKEGVLSSSQGLIIFIALIAKTTILVISLLFFIRALEFNVINVLAGLSIGGFALALGAQDTIKNFFGSLMIFADKQFSSGDWITSGDISGTVEEVGLRTTKIRTFHNSILIVPNSKLADNSIDNMGRRIYRRYSGKFVIKYDTHTDIIDTFISSIEDEISNRADTRKDFHMVYINDFSTYGIEILVYVFFKVPEWEMEMKGKHELITKILNLAHELEIEFAIPPK